MTENIEKRNNIMKIKSISLTEERDPILLELVNEVARVTERKPHDVVKRMLLDACKNILSQPKPPVVSIGPGEIGGEYQTEMKG